MQNNIKSERARLLLTQEDLADALSVDPSTMSRWERNPAQIPSGKAVEMAQLFNCSLDYMFGLAEERKRNFQKGEN